MITKDHETEKTCVFYASEYHLEMILLPYIKQNLENSKIIFFTENDLEKTLNNLLDKINLKESDKEKIKQINWKKDDKAKLKLLNKYENNNEHFRIIINGSQEYIKKIDKKSYKNNVETIHCFNIEKTPDIEEIQKNYSKKLNTNLIK